jgi:circadian clock protein KaiB
MAKIHRFKAKPSSHGKKHQHRERYLLRLYTVGTTALSTRAVQNVCDICEAKLKDRYKLEVIDICQQPGRATECNIIASPTLIKEEPLPVRRIVGDFSDRSKVLLNLAIAG